MRIIVLIGLLHFVSFKASGQDFVWAADFKGDHSSMRTMTTDESGNVYSVVTYMDSVDFDPGPDTHYLDGAIDGKNAIQKLDNEGNFIWVRSFLSVDSPFGNMYVNAMVTDESENLYAAGSFNWSVDFDPDIDTDLTIEVDSLADIFVLKLDEDGDLIWVKTIGGVGYDRALDISIDANNDLCLTGYFDETVDFDPGAGISLLTYTGDDSEAFILKLNTDGEYIWSKSIETTGYSVGSDIIGDASGNLYIAGEFSGDCDFDGDPDTPVLNSGDDIDPFLLKISSAGEFVWVRTIAEEIVHLTSIDLDEEGNIYGAGSFEGDNIDFDCGPGTFYMSSVDRSDIFIWKITDNGEFVWAKEMGGMWRQSVARLAVSNANSIYITGVYDYEFDVNPDEEDAVILPAYDPISTNDFFIANLNKDGEFIEASAFIGEGHDFCGTIKKGIDGGIYLCGIVRKPMDLNPSDTDTYFVGTDTISASVFVLKLVDASVGIVEIPHNNGLNVYPNPTTDVLRIALNDHYSSVRVEIMNNLGGIVQTKVFKNVSELEMELGGKTGAYFVRLITPNGHFVKKIVKTN